MRRRDVALAIAIVGLGAIAVREFTAPDIESALPPAVVPEEGPIAIAAAGDVLLTVPVDFADPGVQAVQQLVAGATLAVANLEMALLDSQEGRGPTASAWPAGTSREARALRRLGFDVLSLANNHAADHGEAGIVATRRLLGAAGVQSAGAGRDLSEARAPALVGGGSRRVAFIAVTTSAAPAARATDSTAAIAGRAGVSPLRYRAEITVDAATFRLLRESIGASQAAPSDGEADEIVVADARVRAGDRTVVDVVVDRADEEALLAAISAARAASELVIVSVHSHEPSNGSAEPADFVARLARAAIDRGASLVVGHGPHRLRGVELRGDGAILYSLGNFAYRAPGLERLPADRYDAGTDLYEAVLAGAQPGVTGWLALEDATWWRSVLALAEFEQGRLTALRLHPVDLGSDRPVADRGWPTLAGSSRAVEILGIMDELSRPFGARVDQATGTVSALPVTAELRPLGVPKRGAPSAGRPVRFSHPY